MSFGKNQIENNTNKFAQSRDNANLDEWNDPGYSAPLRLRQMRVHRRVQKLFEIAFEMFLAGRD